MARIGRPAGSINKLSAKAIQLAEKFECHPLEFLLGTMHDGAATLDQRIDCAKASLPYLVPRLNAIDMRSLIENAPRTPREVSADINGFLERLAQREINAIEDGSLSQANDVVEGRRDLLGDAVPVNERGSEAHG